ncbi:rhogef domain containing protein, partial [Entamoeba invadens IP1]
KKPKICPPEDLSTVFLGFDDVFRINEKLLQDLSNLMNHVNHKSLDADLGEALSEFVPLLSSYKMYVGHSETQFAVLDKLEAKKQFKELLVALQSKITVGHALNLRAYLITPVQRLPRYKLLLEDLINHTPEDHLDLKRLKKALEKVKEINVNINKSVDVTSRQVKLVELAKKLKIVDLVQADRYYVRDDEMIFISNRGKEKRHFFLFNDRLVVTKYADFKIKFDEKLCRVNIEDDSDQSFNVYSAMLSFEVLCTSEEQKREWVNKVVELIAKFDTSLSRKKEKIEYAPLWLPSDIEKCQICGKSFNFMNRKQFCIHCGLCVCNGCYKGRFVFNGVNKRGCDRCMKKALTMNKIVVDDEVCRRKSIVMKSNKEDNIILRLDGVDLQRIRSNANARKKLPAFEKKNENVKKNETEKSVQCEEDENLNQLQNSVEKDEKEGLKEKTVDTSKQLIVSETLPTESQNTNIEKVEKS